MGNHLTFKESDLKRLVKVAGELGFPVEIIEVSRKGDIRILTKPAPRAESDILSPLEVWERKHGVGDA